MICFSLMFQALCNYKQHSRVPVNMRISMNHWWHKPILWKVHHGMLWVRQAWRFLYQVLRTIHHCHSILHRSCRRIGTMSMVEPNSGHLPMENCIVHQHTGHDLHLRRSYRMAQPLCFLISLYPKKKRRPFFLSYHHLSSVW